MKISVNKSIIFIVVQIILRVLLLGFIPKFRMNVVFVKVIAVPNTARFIQRGDTLIWTFTSRINFWK